MVSPSYFRQLGYLEAHKSSYFRESCCELFQIIRSSLSDSRTCQFMKYPKLRYISQPLFEFVYLVGHFDGASQLSSSVSGAGMVLSLISSHCHKLWMGCNIGSNTRSELLTLAGLFFSLGTEIYTPYRSSTIQNHCGLGT